MTALIRLLCPQCQSVVSVPDAAAGGNTDCPSCGKSFPVPTRYTPVVAVEKPPDPPAPPPPIPAESVPDRPPPPPGLVELSPQTALVHPASGYTHRRGLSVSPLFVAWAPVVGLAVILLLTFFPWIGLFPGGYSGYTQSPWGAMVGNFTSDHVIEDVLRLEGPLRQRVRWDWVMVPYLLGLIFAVFLAGAERFLHRRTSGKPPAAVAWLGSLWTKRVPFLTALSGVLLCLIVIQVLAGFGLETGLRKVLANKFAEARQNAGNVTADLNRIDIKEDMELASYRLQTTTWLSLALLLNVLVTLALLGRLGFEHRGPKPPPRVVVEY